MGQCLSIMTGELVKYVDELASLASETTKVHMKNLWPLLFRKAGIPVFDMPPVSEVRSMWPFLAVAVRSAAPAKSFNTLKGVTGRWPDALYTYMPTTGKADEKAKDWLEAKLKLHGL